MTNHIVPGRRFSGRPAPNTLVLSGRGRQRVRKSPKAEPARPNSRLYDWGSALPRPAWREALGLAGFLLAWALLIVVPGLIGLAR